MSQVRQAASILTPEDDGTAFLRLYLHVGGQCAPPVSTLKDLVTQLPARGWRVAPPYFLPPQSGAFFVQASGQGTVTRIGIVGGLHRAGMGEGAEVYRDWFLVASPDEGRAERVEVNDVSFWLLPPAPPAPQPVPPARR